MLALGPSVSAQSHVSTSVIAIYVGRGLDADGFTDAQPGIEDSIKDLQAGSRPIGAGASWPRRRTPTSGSGCAGAAWTFKTTGARCFRSGWRSFDAGTHTDYRVLDVDLTTGTVNRHLHTPQQGDHYANWKKSAGRILDQAAAWIDANRGRILAQRH